MIVSTHTPTSIVGEFHLLIFIYSLKKYLPSACYVPGSVLGPRNPTVNETGSKFRRHELIFQQEDQTLLSKLLTEQEKLKTKKKIHAIGFHFYKTLEQAKLISNDRSQNGGFLRGTEIDWKGPQGANFWGDGNVL